VLSFKHKADAEVLQMAFRENLWHCGLELNDAKKKLHPFGLNCPPLGGGIGCTGVFRASKHGAGSTITSPVWQQ
jgi:hypothetical protein